MENCCYTIAIRQLRCENGIPRQIDNVYTNVTVNTVFPLSFGYTATLVGISDNYITITLSNPNFIPDITFNIPRDSYKIFNLPKENGTISIYIGAASAPCPKQIVCCSSS